ncbi:MAG: septal ring lytic transglycosylase RlpA family protein [Propionibacteriaceae bacterium]|nr:septal ring lytic transglycosylase RlpA family protein [Propionibacteriaceae bacterium]
MVNYYNQGIKTDQGQITANGEVFSPHTMTGAHHSLPFGTLVRITNADTGRSAVIRINDRGATSGGRCFSLTVAAYSAITSMTQKSFNATWQIV